MSDELKTLTNSDQEIGSNLGANPVERNYNQENHYKRLDQELDSFASGGKKSVNFKHAILYASMGFLLFYYVYFTLFITKSLT